MKRLSIVVFIIVVVVYTFYTDYQKQRANEAMVELGHRLFYDADLSINGSMSCATCHEQHRAFADGNAKHPGALDDLGVRNVPGLANIGEFKNLTWAHNSVSDLAQQALMPIMGTEPVEMGMSGNEEQITKRLNQNSCYQKLFALAFPDENGAINLDTVSRALGHFEKSLVSYDSSYDNRSLSTQAKVGESLFFGKANCNSCHSAPLFSDDDFHEVAKSEDMGLYNVTKNEKDRGYFRTPSLRNGALTAPYFHDGSAKNLKEAIKKHEIEINQSLDDNEITSLISFIESLSDQTFINNPKFGQPDKGCNDVI